MQTQERPSTHPKDPTLETLNLVQSLCSIFMTSAPKYP